MAAVLTKEQKDEIRRLTQLANRRIKFAAKEYARAGASVLPKEVVGNLQIKEQWATANTPISRSVKFESERDYKKQLAYLRSFDPKAMKEAARPSISEYTMIQRAKTVQALETSFGVDMNAGMMAKLNTMSAPRLSEFWDTYNKKAAKLGFKYSSGQAMAETLEEFFPEDLQGLQTSMDKRPEYI